jgi:hypothetical protein
VIEVDLDRCTGKAEVLQAIARAFNLPSWFGMNLDALYDSLTDLPDTGMARRYRAARSAPACSELIASRRCPARCISRRG